jgi:hypothetical protein
MQDLLRIVQINIPFTMLNDSYLKSKRNSLPIITLEPHCENDLWLSLAYLSEVWPR